MTNEAPASSAARGDRRLAGVDRERDLDLRREPLDHRHDAAKLLVLRHRIGARPGRLAADVDQVGALASQPLAVGDGRGQDRGNARRPRRSRASRSTRPSAAGREPPRSATAQAPLRLVPVGCGRECARASRPCRPRGPASAGAGSGAARRPACARARAAGSGSARRRRRAEHLFLGLAGEQLLELLALDRLALEQDPREAVEVARGAPRTSLAVWCASSTMRRISSSISRAISSE